MSYYAVEPWQNQPRQASWEHAPSRSGASSSAGGRDDAAPSFLSQLEEVERAIENLSRSGKMPMGPGSASASSFRRDASMLANTVGSAGPAGPRAADFGGAGHHAAAPAPAPPPPAPAPVRHHSMSDFDPRQASHGPTHGHGPHNSGNVQGFYQNQRYAGGPATPHGGHAAGRKSEADQMQQAQRRMAAQRERELRNYHQEQQYNRGKPERTISPNMSEEERRELIARQHRALYGDEHNQVPFDGNASEHAQPPGSSAPTGANNATASSIASQGNVSAPRTSTSSPKEAVPAQGAASPTRQHAKTLSTSHGVPISQAPIGTRPTAGSISQNKRPTPPATSPLGIASADRAPSSASNPGKDNSTGSGTPNTWGSGSGVWGKNPLGVQASVWG